MSDYDVTYVLPHTCPNCGCGMSSPGKLEQEIERMRATVGELSSRVHEVDAARTARIVELEQEIERLQKALKKETENCHYYKSRMSAAEDRWKDALETEDYCKSKVKGLLDHPNEPVEYIVDKLCAQLAECRQLLREACETAGNLGLYRCGVVDTGWLSRAEKAAGGGE